MTAAELIAQLADDPEYVRRKEASDADWQLRAEVLARAEQPIVADLRHAGVEVDSVWDLVNTSVPYPDALPVLLEHLERGGYPDRVVEGVARALAVEPASFAWPTFRLLYLAAEGRGEEEGLAVALAASATADHLEDLIALLEDETRRDTQLHFLRAINRVGGKRGREVLASLQDDPFYGKEARALLGG